MVKRSGLISTAAIRMMIGIVAKEEDVSSRRSNTLKTQIHCCYTTNTPPYVLTCCLLNPPLGPLEVTHRAIWILNGGFGFGLAQSGKSGFIF